MSEKKRKFKTFAKWFLIRLPFVLIIGSILMIIALKLVERYPDPLREGFEEYLSGVSGANATIGHVEKIAFFPNVDISLRDLTMHNKSNAAIIDMQVESAHISTPFWSMLIGGSRLNDIEITNLIAGEGQMTPLSVKLDSIRIEDKDGPDQYGSFFVVSGLYGGQKLLFEAEIEKLKKGYHIPKNVSFSLEIGQSSLSAILMKGFSSLRLGTTVFFRKGKQSVAKEYNLIESKEYNKDNPLSCLFYNGDAQECDIYLEEKDI